MANLDKRAGLQKKVSSVFKDVPIPQGNDSQQVPGAYAPDDNPGNPTNRMSTDRPISQSSLIKHLNRAQDSLDKAAPEQSDNIFPQPTPANNETPQSPPIKQLNQDEESSNKIVPEQSANVFPKLTPANNQIPQSALIKNLNQAAEAVDKSEPQPPANVFPKPAPANNQMPQSPLIKKVPQSKESFKEAAPVKQLESDPFIEMPSGGLLQRIKDKLFTPKPGASPAKQKALVIMVPILLIVMVFVLRQVISKAPDKTEGAPKDNTPVEVANADSGIKIDWQVPELLPAMMRDPIKLPGQSNGQIEEPNGIQNQGSNETTNETKPVIIKVKDIVYSADKPSAFIGSKIVYVGDKVDGVTIVRIDRDRVEFEKNGKRWVQKMRE